jgi:hypothetical protein
MSGIQTTQPVKNAAISIQITRADGTVEDLGVVAYHSTNPLKRALFAVRQRLGQHITEEQLFGPMAGQSGDSSTPQE